MIYNIVMQLFSLYKCINTFKVNYFLKFKINYLYIQFLRKQFSITNFNCQSCI